MPEVKNRIINFIEKKAIQPETTVYKVTCNGEIKEVLKYNLNEEKNLANKTLEEVINSQKIVKDCRKKIKITLESGFPTHFKALVSRNGQETHRECCIQKNNNHEVIILSNPTSKK